MTITSIGAAGTGQRNTSGNTISVNLSVSIESGNLAVVIAALDNTGTTDADFSEVTSVTDPQGNTWTKLGEYTNGQTGAGLGATVSAWYCIPTTTIPDTDNLTVNLANSVTDAAATVWEFDISAASVALAGSVQVLANDAGDPGSMSISGLSSAETLFIRAIGSENEFTTFTPTTNYTQFTSAISTTSGGAADNMSVHGEFRILTDTGDTSDPSASSPYDHASVYFALREVAGTTDTALSTAGAATGTLAAALLASVPLSATGAAVGTLNAAALLASDLSSVGAATGTLEGVAVSGASETALSTAGASTGTLATALLSATDLTATGAATGTLDTATTITAALTAAGAAVGTLAGNAATGVEETALSAAGAAAAILVPASFVAAALVSSGVSIGTLATGGAENAYLTWGAQARRRRKELEDDDEEVLQLVALLAPRLFGQGVHQ